MLLPLPLRFSSTPWLPSSCVTSDRVHGSALHANHERRATSSVLHPLALVLFRPALCYVPSSHITFPFSLSSLFASFTYDTPPLASLPLTGRPPPPPTHAPSFPQAFLRSPPSFFSPGNGRRARSSSKFSSTDAHLLLASSTYDAPYRLPFLNDHPLHYLRQQAKSIFLVAHSPTLPMKFLFALVTLLAPLLATAAVARSQSPCPDQLPVVKCCRFFSLPFATGCVSPTRDVTRDDFMEHCREDLEGRIASCCEPPKNEDYPDDSLTCGNWRGWIVGPGLQIQEGPEGRDGL
ncbi:hypothetical protein R3P38DRAFT_3498056 [Favolaschia claudopus]|uniref:Uncharacterized protein n=1 Tax=Favolaschia claudopus TaxID=2862362 RepID=A0AAW0C3H8_9AGAR